LHDELRSDGPTSERPPSAGLDDLVIVPLVLVAVAGSKLLKAVFSILIYVLDYAFPILLQLMRIPLLTAGLVGDGMELFLEGGPPVPPRVQREARRMAGASAPAVDLAPAQHQLSSLRTSTPPRL
jgi:hypothetical protein